MLTRLLLKFYDVKINFYFFIFLGRVLGLLETNLV